MAGNAMLVFGIVEARPAFDREDGGKKEFFSVPRAHNPLINLESTPEMEAKGSKRKGVSGLHCLRLKFDRARLGNGGASGKDDGFDFPVSWGGPADADDDQSSAASARRFGRGGTSARLQGAVVGSKEAG
jgi:hypothetical protein